MNRDMKKPKKHIAEQTVMAIVDPPIKLSLTLVLRGDLARMWRRYQEAHLDFAPSNGQLAEALIAKALHFDELSRSKSQSEGRR